MIQSKKDIKMSHVYKKNKQFRKGRRDPVTLTYFVEVAWGFSTGFLSKFRSRVKDRTKEVEDIGID